MALHINVPAQKVKEVRLLTLSRKGKKNICVLRLIDTNGFIAIHMSAVHGKAGLTPETSFTWMGGRAGGSR